jgi:exodeoxyribonuclease VII small subunit
VKKSNFEKDMSRLEEISLLLEKEDIPLEEVLLLYEEGIALSKSCLDTLKNAELKITVIRKKMNEISEGQEEISEEI